ncbi:MAG: M23 family metallopeptidase [Deltaproteobacteria bacterium]|nr:M23 family metallopeptidase [Deltaproteobacteria bacterium]
MTRTSVFALTLGLCCAAIGPESSRAPEAGPALAPRPSPAEVRVWNGFFDSGERLIDAARVRADTVALIDLSRRLAENRADAERRHGSLPPALARRATDLRAAIRATLEALFESGQTTGKKTASLAIPQRPVHENRALPGGFDGVPSARIREDAGGLFTFRWPLHNAVVGVPFGYRRDPIDRDRLGFHDGVDMLANIGDPVFAAAPGDIVSAGRRGGGGIVVTIRHGAGYRTHYLHLSRVFVEPGDRVSGGSLIALAGNTGRSTGPHLHFTVQRHGKPVDPVTIIGLRVGR